MVPKLDCALVIAGHGSTVNPDSSAPTFDHAEEIIRRSIFGEVHSAFWKEEPSFRQALYMTQCDQIYIVPNFISEGYFTETIIPREFGLTGPVTHLHGKTICYCEPVGSHLGMTDLLLKRAAEIAPGVIPSEATLLIVGHGTGLNENSAVAAKREVDLIRQRGIYREVISTYMEEAPLISEWDRISTQNSVVVVPFFISDGLHSYQDIPVLLGIESETGSAASQRDVFRRNPYHLRGRTLYYACAIGTESHFADIILDQVAAFDRLHPSELRTIGAV